MRPYSAERSDADLYILYGRTSHGQKVFERYGKVISKACKKLLWFVVLSPGIFLPEESCKVHLEQNENES